jgi:hypothetical protein
VAGVAALMLSVRPDLTQEQVANIIRSTARKARTATYTYQTTAGRPNGTWNSQMGHGVVDAYAAVHKAINPTLTVQYTGDPLKQFIPVEITVNNVPDGTYTVDLRTRNLQNNSFYLGTQQMSGTSFTFFPTISGDYTLEVTLQSPAGARYTASAWINVDSNYAWLEAVQGKYSLAPGEVETYVLRTSEGSVDPMAFSNLNLFFWDYGQNLVLDGVQPSTTSIRLKSNRDLNACGNVSRHLKLQHYAVREDVLVEWEELAFNRNITLTSTVHPPYFNIEFMEFDQGNWTSLLMFYTSPGSGNFVWDPSDIPSYLGTPQIYGNTLMIFVPQNYIFNFYVSASQTNACGTHTDYYYYWSRGGGTPVTYFEISPNPAKDRLLISLIGGNALVGSSTPPTPLTNPVSTYELYEQQGARLIQTGSFRGVSHTLNVSRLRKGMYLLKIMNDTHSEVHRVVID